MQLYTMWTVRNKFQACAQITNTNIQNAIPTSVAGLDITHCTNSKMQSCHQSLLWYPTKTHVRRCQMLPSCPFHFAIDPFTFTVEHPYTKFNRCFHTWKCGVCVLRVKNETKRTWKCQLKRTSNWWYTHFRLQKRTMKCAYCSECAH